MKLWHFYLPAVFALNSFLSQAANEPVAPPQPVNKGKYRVFEGNGGGEFNAEESQWLTHYVWEASIMVKAGLEAVVNYNTDIAARKHVKVFFGVDPNTQKDGTCRPDENSMNTLKGYLVGVNDWLNGQAYSPAKKPESPIMFSGDGWSVKQGWDEVIMDESTNKPHASGEKLKDAFSKQYDKYTKPRPKNGRDGKNQDSTEYADQDPGSNQQGQGSSNEPKRVPPWNFPYWSEKLRGYWWGDDYGPGKGMCSRPGYKAATDVYENSFYITTICRNNIQSPNPVISNKVPPATLGKDTEGKDIMWKRRETLADKIPQSVTLLHEFFHYVDMDTTWPDEHSNQGSLPAIMANAKDTPEKQAKNRNDPEALAYFCAASWFSQQEYGDQKQRWEFSLGSATPIPKGQ